MVRLLSGVAIAAIALGAILFLPLLGLRLFASVFAACAGYEYLRFTGFDGKLAAIVVASCWLVSMEPLAYLLGLVAVVIAAELARILLESGWARAFAAVSRASLYIGVPLGLLVALHARYGWRATVLLVGTIALSDSAQYYSGRTFGRHLLAPVISPKKTIEGAIGGVVVGTLVMVVAGARLVPFVETMHLVALGLIVVVLGILGDLFESREKRRVGVKDSGNLIPGHGGVLDRIDALLFAAPAFYFYLRSVE
jgi:phosphatidate cytidylyltransferase